MTSKRMSVRCLIFVVIHIGYRRAYDELEECAIALKLNTSWQLDAASGEHGSWWPALHRSSGQEVEGVRSQEEECESENGKRGEKEDNKVSDVQLMMIGRNACLNNEDI